MPRSAEGQLQGEMPEDAADEVQVQRQHEEKDSGNQSWRRRRGGPEMRISLETAVSSASIIYTLLICGGEVKMDQISFWQIERNKCVIL